jgi:hypothetical protein
MLLDPLPYIQSALLCTFADASSSLHRDKIRSFRNTDDALDFCRDFRETHLHFIVDQINALEHEAPNTDLVHNDRKDVLSAFLQRIAIGHCIITSASANYRTAQRMAQKQTGELGMSMMGGMSEVRNVPLDAISFFQFQSASVFAGRDGSVVDSSPNQSAQFQIQSRQG